LAQKGHFDLWFAKNRIWTAFQRKRVISAQKRYLDWRLAQMRHLGAKAEFGLEVGANAAFLRKSGILAQKRHLDLRLAQKRHLDLRLSQKRNFGAKASFGIWT
jgi:hypothetical protein